MFAAPSSFGRGILSDRACVPRSTRGGLARTSTPRVGCRWCHHALVARPLRLSCAVGVVAIVVGSALLPVEASAPPVDDDATLVDALIDAAAAFGLALDKHCVEGIVAGTDVAYLDDELARQALLAGLEFTADEPLSTDLTGGSTVVTVRRGFLVFPFPVIVDVDELRRQLLACVAGQADPELVDRVAARLLARAEYGLFVDERCVETMLTAFSDEMLRLWLDNLDNLDSTPPATFDPMEVIEEDLAALYWLMECEEEQVPSTTEPMTPAG